MTELYVKEVRKALSAKGSLLFVKPVPGIKYNEVAEVILESGETRFGQVIDVSRDVAVLQVFGGVSEVNLKNAHVRFKGEVLRIPVSLDMLGRITDIRI